STSIDSQRTVGTLMKKELDDLSAFEPVPARSCQLLSGRLSFAARPPLLSHSRWEPDAVVAHFGPVRSSSSLSSQPSVTLARFERRPSLPTLLSPPNLASIARAPMAQA